MAFAPGLIEGEDIDPRVNLKVNPGGDGGHKGGGDGDDDKSFTIRMHWGERQEVFNGRYGNIWTRAPNPDSHIKTTRDFNG